MARTYTANHGENDDARAAATSLTGDKSRGSDTNLESWKLKMKGQGKNVL